MKKILQFLILLIFLLILKETKATEIFSDGFESGTFTPPDPWDGTRIDTGCIAEVIEIDPYSEIHHAHFETFSGSYYSYVYENIDEQSILHTRIYIKFNSLPSDVAVGIRLLSGDSVISYTRILDSKWQLRGRNDVNYDYDIGTTILETDRWYSVELRTVIDGTNGEYVLYLDGVEEISLTNKDSSQYGNVNKVQVGLFWASSMDMYVDDVIIDDGNGGSTTTTSTTTTVSGTTTTIATTTITIDTTSSTTTTIPVGYVSISGTLRDKNNDPVDSTVTAIGQPSVDTDSTGYYSLSVPTGIYDLQYDLTSFYIPNYLIKLISLDILSDLIDVFTEITGDSVNNIVSFKVDVSDNQLIEINSEKPRRISADGIPMTEVSSMPSSANEWYYDSGQNKLYLIASLTPITTSTTTTISSTTTTIPTSADYTITGDGVTYTGVDNNDPDRTTSDSDASAVISTVLEWMSSGQRVEFIGDFTIDSTVIVDVDNILLDCTQATMRLTASIGFDIKSSKVTILGGHWIGTSNAGQQGIRFFGSNANHGTLDGLEIEGFTGDGTLVIQAGYGSDYLTIKNCYMHDNKDPTSRITEINLVNGGHNNIINNRLTGASMPIFVQSTATHNLISGCEFSDWMYTGGHAIYLDGGSGLGGHNVVTGCRFHDSNGQSGIQIKCQNNSIHNNSFYNLLATEDSVALSIYSEYVPSYANDNKIYNNTFTDIAYAIWNGKGSARSDTPTPYPTLRNKYFNNIFTRVTNCFKLNAWGNYNANTVEDTWIYYNDFVDCTNIFAPTSWSPNLIMDTVVAYNTFDTEVPQAQQDELKSYVNTLIYGNEPWLDDYPDPLPPDLPIPSPS